MARETKDARFPPIRIYRWHLSNWWAAVNVLTSREEDTTLTGWVVDTLNDAAEAVFERYPGSPRPDEFEHRPKANPVLVSRRR